MEDGLKQGLGNWVDDDKFFNRDVEMARFIEYLRDGTNLSLLAPRRIGKTSFMREAARRLSTEIIPLQVDFQKSLCSEDAIVTLSLAAKKFDGVWNKIAAGFGGVLSKLDSIKVSELSVTIRGDLTDTNWKTKGDAIFETLAEVSAEQEKKVVLFCDEVPILVSRILNDQKDDSQEGCIRRADAFMSWLRDNAQRHHGSVVQVITGSIGLEPILSGAGLSGTLNAYHPFELGVWDDKTGAACLMALSKGKNLGLPETAAEQMIGQLGSAIPHHVQLFFDHVCAASMKEESPCIFTPEFIDRIYNDNMTGLRGHADLSHMEERLKMVLPDGHQFTCALELLTETAVVGSIDSKTILLIAKEYDQDPNSLRKIMNILEHDGYLTLQDEQYTFVSKLVKDWWRGRFGFTYTPKSKRE